MSVHRIIGPILSGFIAVGAPAPGEAIAFPRSGEGYLFKDPFRVEEGLPLRAGNGPGAPAVGIGRLDGRYPGNIPLQFCLLMNDRAGLYVGCHDAGQHHKNLSITADAPENSASGQPEIMIAHKPGFRPGEIAALPYDTIVGVFQGDWTAGADIYKAWARRQWWCEKKLAERDIPQWMREGFAVFQMSNYDVPDNTRVNHSLDLIAETVTDVSRQAETPLLGLIFNWEGAGA